jgi:hypothetical protein
MSYEIKEKQRIAEFLGLPFDYFYYFSSSEWRGIEKRYKAFTSEAMSTFEDTPETCVGFKTSLKLKHIYLSYKEHVEKQGRNVKTEILQNIDWQPASLPTEEDAYRIYYAED